MSTHRCWVEVDGDALRHNFKVLRGLIPATTKLLAVVKANAYGHGLAAVGRELEEMGVDWLGVANVVEGGLLRAAGVKLPILLLSATLPDEMADALREDLTLTISSREEARMAHEMAKKAGLRAGVHFKIDTGMGRLGHWHESAAEELRAIRAFERVEVTGLYTHFASADDDAATTQQQWDWVAPFFAANENLLRHAANSPAVTRRYGFNADMVRAGLALYGIAPNPADDELNLRPVLTWKTRIVQLREVAAGRTISYGGTYRTERREKHAVVGMGYGDGYFRLNGPGGHLLVGGVRCPIRGRVTMDQIVVDVSGVPECRLGDEVVALGAQGSAAIPARELARSAQTIPWEILTNVGSRVPRIHRNFRKQPDGASGI